MRSSISKDYILEVGGGIYTWVYFTGIWLPSISVDPLSI